MGQQPDLMPMTVVSRRMLTPTICEFTLEAPDRRTLPAFEPGAHISMETPAGAMRWYSLVNDGEAPRRFVIAVKRDPESRGGSTSMHDAAEVGITLNVGAPANDFPLADAPRYLLIAGGIGVTPIYAMARHLARRGKPFEMIYCTRSPEETAYLDEMTEALGDRLTVHHDDGDPERMYDFWDHFVEVRDMRVYCCGPHPLMEEIKAVSGHWPEGRVSFEDFKPVDALRAHDVPFEVTLERSGRTVSVPADRTILDAVRDAGVVGAVSSCESGICGTCKCRLIAGDVDHRDMVLRDDERADHIMICVSRSKSGTLVIDL